MVLNRKEYEEMERLREVGRKYENLYNDLDKKVKDMKTYLKVRLDLLGMTTHTSHDEEINCLCSILAYLEKV